MDKTTVLEFRSEGAVERSTRAPNRPPVSLMPMRSIDLRRRGVSRLGWYWSSTNKGHVTFFDKSERACVLMLDFDRSVRHIVSQPLAFPLEPDRPAPSYLVTRANGDAELVYSHAAKVGRSEIEDVAEITGWKVSQATTLTPEHQAAITWIAAFRHPRHLDHALRSRLLNFFAVARPLAEGFGLDLTPSLFHLIWTGDLVCELGRGLHDDSLVHTA